MTKRGVQYIAVVWAAFAAVMAIRALGDTSGPARVLVTVASIGFPLCAVGSAFAMESNRRRTAGLLLAVSAATPLYFAQLLGVIPLAVGVSLLARRGQVAA